VATKRKEASFLNVGVIAEDRLGDGAEGVKEKRKLILKAGRKGRFHWGKWGENKFQENDWGRGKPEF
jgi:hypothetical protein